MVARGTVVMPDAADTLGLSPSADSFFSFSFLSEQVEFHTLIH